MGIVSRIHIAIIALGLAAVGCAPSAAPGSEPAVPAQGPSTPIQVAVPQCLPGQVLCRCNNRVFCAASCSSCNIDIAGPPASNALALALTTEACGDAR